MIKKGNDTDSLKVISVQRGTMVSGERSAGGGETCLQKQQEHQVLERIRFLIRNDADLNCDDSDEFLLRFAKACDCDAQLAYKLIITYFQAKRNFPEEFLFNAPSNYVHVISRPDLGFVNTAGDVDGRPILFLRFGNVDPAQDSWPQLMQSATLILESLSFEAVVQDNGVDLVVDCTNFSLKIMKWATPYKLSAIMKFFQECVPVKFDFIHIVNAPLTFRIFYAALGPFMSDGLREKIVWHKKPFKTLMDKLGESNTPPHLGGTLKLEEVENWYTDLVLDKAPIFKRFFPHIQEEDCRLRI